MHEDRRQWERRRVTLRLLYWDGSDSYSGLAENVGPSGLFVATYALRAVGAVIPLQFALDGRALDCRAEVRWVRPYNALAPDVMPGMGLKLIEPDRTVRDAIERLVAVHPA